MGEPRSSLRAVTVRSRPSTSQCCRAGHRGDVVRERCARRGPWLGRRRCRRVARGGAGRIVRAAHDDHPQRSGTRTARMPDADPMQVHAAQLFADDLVVSPAVHRLSLEMSDGQAVPSGAPSSRRAVLRPRSRRCRGSRSPTADRRRARLTRTRLRSAGPPVVRYLWTLTLPSAPFRGQPAPR